MTVLGAKGKGDAAQASDESLNIFEGINEAVFDGPQIIRNVGITSVIREGADGVGEFP